MSTVFGNSKTHLNSNNFTDPGIIIIIIIIIITVMIII